MSDVDSRDICDDMRVDREQSGTLTVVWPDPTKGHCVVSREWLDGAVRRLNDLTVDPLESGLGALLAENARLRELLERALTAWDRIDHIDVSDSWQPFVSDEFENIATELQEMNR